MAASRDNLFVYPQFSLARQALTMLRHLPGRIAALALSAGLAIPAWAQTPEVQTPVAQTLEPSWVNSLQWRQIGPANMGGRITALAVYEADPSTFWASTASGGLLKTTNKGKVREYTGLKGSARDRWAAPRPGWLGPAEGALGLLASIGAGP